MRVVTCGLVALALVPADAVVTSAQESASPTRRSFVACPIVRDTKTQPCWLAEYEGELYYLGQQGGVGQRFLSAAARSRGTRGRHCRPGSRVRRHTAATGQGQRDARADAGVSTMLPAEDGIEAPPPIPSPRGPAPSWVKVAGPGDVTLYFDFDNDFFSLHVTVALTNLAKHVVETRASRVEVTGFRAYPVCRMARCCLNVTRLAPFVRGRWRIRWPGSRCPSD